MIRYVERSCYNDTILWSQSQGIICSFDTKAFLERYSATCARIIYNIQSSANTKESLVTRMSPLGQAACDDDLIKKISPLKAAEMTSHELHPEATREIREEIAFREKQKPEIEPSRFYTCRECGNNKTTKTTFHSGASDEADTCIIRCLVCPHWWYAK
jgi:DNA-directed RNA polymerase subunit M/transcription elongation factor TFIIS